MVKISPSILSCDFAALAEDVKKSEAGGAQYLHVDVMDGVFVPNISFGSVVVKALRKHSKQIFDVHLMIIDPIRYIDDFIKAGADIITIHHESCENPLEVVKYIKDKGIKASISIKPKTSYEVLKPYLPYVDMILIMTVEPGFGGQSFIMDTIENIKGARDLVKESNREIEIEVDGGISEKNVELCTSNGANVIVAGSAIFGKEDIAQAVRVLQKKADETYIF